MGEIKMDLLSSVIKKKKWYLFAINNHIDTQIARTRTSVPLQSKKKNRSYKYQ